MIGRGLHGAFTLHPFAEKMLIHNRMESLYYGFFRISGCESESNKRGGFAHDMRFRINTINNMFHHKWEVAQLCNKVYIPDVNYGTPEGTYGFQLRFTDYELRFTYFSMYEL